MWTNGERSCDWLTRDEHFEQLAPYASTSVESAASGSNRNPPTPPLLSGKALENAVWEWEGSMRWGYGAVVPHGLEPWLRKNRWEKKSSVCRNYGDCSWYQRNECKFFHGLTYTRKHCCTMCWGEARFDSTTGKLSCGNWKCSRHPYWKSDP